MLLQRPRKLIIREAAKRIDDAPGEAETNRWIYRAKLLAGQTAMDVAASMLEVAGTSATRKGHALERIFRGARCGDCNRRQVQFAKTGWAQRRFARVQTSIQRSTMVIATGQGAAFPPSVKQGELWEKFFSRHYSNSAMAKRMFSSVAVDTRNAVANPIFDDVSSLSTGARMERYLPEALPLATAAPRCSGADEFGFKRCRAARSRVMHWVFDPGN